MKKILLLACISSVALVAESDLAGGFDDIDSTVVAAQNTAKGIFRFIVMAVSWGLVLSAVFFTNKYKEKQLDRLDNKQGEEGSFFMLYAKVAMVATLALVVVGFIIGMLWGKILPIAAEDDGEQVKYGKVIVNALTGKVNNMEKTVKFGE